MATTNEHPNCAEIDAFPKSEQCNNCAQINGSELDVKSEDRDSKPRQENCSEADVDPNTECCRDSTINDDENTPLLRPPVTTRCYRRRWYVLGVFSFFALVQTCVWNTYGPIAQSAKIVFGWTDANIGLLADWGNVVYILFMIPFSWLMDVKGLRLSLMTCCFLTAVAAGMRCITFQPLPATWLNQVAAILNGVAGTVPFAGPPLLSSIWFPPKQRATSTAISTVFTYIGLSVSFIVGPLIVPEPTNMDDNMTDVSPNSTSTGGIENLTQATDITPLIDGIRKLMYVECGAAVLCLVLVVVYFPNKPPHPPSFTASQKRTSYKDGLKGLFTNYRFLLVMGAYGFPNGVYSVFLTVLDVDLDGVNVSQNIAGWLGFYASVGGCVAALLMSVIADRFLKYMKLMLLGLFLLATSSTVWFVLLRLNYIPFNTSCLYASCILSGVFINCAIPLFFELACETSYPIAEGVSGGVMTVMDNFTGVLFLSILQLPNIGVIWMNWALLGAIAITIPLLLLLKEKYTRTNLDLEITVPLPVSDT